MRESVLEKIRLAAQNPKYDEEMRSKLVKLLQGEKEIQILQKVLNGTASEEELKMAGVILSKLDLSKV